VSAPIAAPPRPPISAPAPALPAAAPIAAPVPAPSNPPDSPRSPGVVPHPESTRPANRIEQAPKLTDFVNIRILPLARVAGSKRAQKTMVPDAGSEPLVNAQLPPCRHVSYSPPLSALVVGDHRLSALQVGEAPPGGRYASLILSAIEVLVPTYVSGWRRRAEIAPPRRTEDVVRIAHVLEHIDACLFQCLMR
jgi:hypothetical protein